MDGSRPCWAPVGPRLAQVSGLLHGSVCQGTAHIRFLEERWRGNVQNGPNEPSQEGALGKARVISPRFFRHADVFINLQHLDPPAAEAELCGLLQQFLSDPPGHLCRSI